jgi:hypothetical protein
MRRFRPFLEWAGVLALSFLMAEVALRVVLDVQPLTPGQFLFEPHPTRGWTHKPGARDEYVKIATRQEIQINSLGLREREIPHGRVSGTWRILVLGDSQVVGFEVAQHETFTRVAEDALRSAGYRVEIINAGFRGYGTDQVLLFLREEGLAYRPDVVLYLWSYNDPEDNMTVHRPFRRYGKAWFDLGPNGELSLRGTPVPEFGQRVNLKIGEDGREFEIEVPLPKAAALWLRDASMTRSSVVTALASIVLVAPSVWQGLRGVASYQDFQPPLDRSGRLFRVTAALVRELQRTAESSGAVFRLLGAEGPWGLALREELGIEHLAVGERFRASVRPADDVIVPFDSHLNARGHRLYGEALAGILADEGLAGPRGGASNSVGGSEAP